MEYLEVDASQLPMALLLEADPAKPRIDAYLTGSWGFTARESSEVVGAV